MRKLGKLLVVLALVLASTGTTAANAGKPTVPDPVITLYAPSATCVATESGYHLVLGVPEPFVEGGVLSNLSLDVSRMAAMTRSGYTQTIRHESWYFGWWDGSDATAPSFPYILNSADTYDPSDPEVVPSWTGHHLTGTLDSGVTVTELGYFEVGVWVGAVATPPRGRRGSARADTGDSWVLQCTGDGQQPTLMALPELTWCDEDAWTHENLGPGLWTWNEDTDSRIQCPLT